MRSYFIIIVFVGLILNIVIIHSSIAQVSKNGMYAVSNVPETNFKHYVSADLKKNSPGQMEKITPLLTY